MNMSMKIIALLALLAGFQPSNAMKLNSQAATTSYTAYPIVLLQSELSQADNLLWRFVFKACHPDTDEKGMDITLNCLKTLVCDKGANPNSLLLDKSRNANYSPLIFAVNSHQPNFELQTKLIKQLVAVGADINCISSMGTPLHAAVLNDNARIIPLLVKLGANINKRNAWGQSALFLVLYRGSQEAFDILKKFPELDCTLEDNQGQTPLHYAVLRANPSCETVEVLLARKANPYATDRLGHSALDYARDGERDAHENGQLQLENVFHEIVERLQGNTGEIKPKNDVKASFLTGTLSSEAHKVARAQALVIAKKAKIDKKKKKAAQAKSKQEKKRNEPELIIETTSPTKKIREALDAMTLQTSSTAPAIRKKLLMSDDTHSQEGKKQGISVDRLAARVLDWESETFLAKQKETAQSIEEFAQSVYYHQIPVEVINCIIDYGTSKPYASKKYPQDIGTKYYIRGTMVFENGYNNPWIKGCSQQAGYYHCTMNSTGTIYHVGFDPISDGSNQLSAYGLPLALQPRILEFPGFARGIKHTFKV